MCRRCSACVGSPPAALDRPPPSPASARAHDPRPGRSAAGLSGRFFQSGADLVLAVSTRGARETAARTWVSRRISCACCTTGSTRRPLTRSGPRGPGEPARAARRLGPAARRARRSAWWAGWMPKARRTCWPPPRRSGAVPVPVFCLRRGRGRTGEAGTTARFGDSGRLQDRLILTGPREDIPAALAAFDVLAHLPRDESFGLALVEAMAAGLPTVATDIGGCREVVRHDVTGLLTPPGDSAALTRALSRFAVGSGAAASDGRGRRAESAEEGFLAVPPDGPPAWNLRGVMSWPVPILMYHAVENAPRPPQYKHFYVLASEFAGQMRALKRAGYTAMTFDDLDAALRGDASAAAKAHPADLRRRLRQPVGQRPPPAAQTRVPLHGLSGLGESGDNPMTGSPPRATSRRRC